MLNVLEKKNEGNVYWAIKLIVCRFITQKKRSPKVERVFHSSQTAPYSVQCTRRTLYYVLTTRASTSSENEKNEKKRRVSIVSLLNLNFYHNC